MAKALITGIAGQDGSCLADSLLAKRNGVHGLIRRSSTFGHSRTDRIHVATDDSGTSLSSACGGLQTTMTQAGLQVDRTMRTIVSVRSVVLIAEHDLACFVRAL